MDSYASRVQALAQLMLGLDEKQMIILLLSAGASAVEALLEGVDLLNL